MRRAMLLVLLCLTMVLGLGIPAGADHRQAQDWGEPLHVGMTGDDRIRTWQEAVGVTADGDFGPATQRATRQWQREKGLLEHGWVGPVTWAAMFGSESPPARVYFEGAGWGHGVGMSQWGAQGMALQGKTPGEILAYYYGDAAIVPTTDHQPAWFAEDPFPLWVNLLDEVDEVAFEARDGDLVLCQDLHRYLLAGDVDDDTEASVRILQERLVELGYDAPVNGEFDAATEAAVEAFQADEGLAVDGVVGPETGGALWSDEPGECFLETVVPSTALLPVLTVEGADRCRFDLASQVAGCTASVHGLSDTSRVAIFPRTYQGTNYAGLQEFANGVLRIRPVGDSGRVHAVLETDLDSYIAGINEVPASWKPAALQAQAIAARSYALYGLNSLGPEAEFSPNRRASCWCHLYSDTKSQVFSGYQRAIELGWKEAVEASAGTVLSHPTEGLVQAFYSSASGGRTENNNEVWGGDGRAYLRSVDDPWVLDPDLNWSAVWVEDDPTPASVADTYGLDTLERIAVTARKTSGSVAEVTIVGTKDGEPVTLTRTGDQVRRTFGLPSSYFNVSWPEPATTPVAAPAATPEFTDIDGSVHASSITFIAARGITRGCNPPDNTRFCPQDPVSRGQMAAFLRRALEGLVEAGEPVAFADTPGTTFEDDIAWLSATGITRGCTEDRYCPDKAVTRGQMAAFLRRALEHLIPVEGTKQFEDVTGSTFEGDVAWLGASGITQGCNPPDNTRFCPEEQVSREQMATFLARAIKALEG